MDMLLISNIGLLVPEPLFLSIKNNKKILTELTVKEKQVRRNNSAYCMAPILRKAYKTIVFNKIRYILFPRIFIIKLRQYLPDNKLLIEPSLQINNLLIDDTPAIDEKYISEKILYSYQEAAVEYLYNKSIEQYGVLYLQMDTGLGKSRVGCAFIAKIQKRGLIIVPTKAIAEQWKVEFLEMYPTLNVNIYKNIDEGKASKKQMMESSDVDIIIINTFRDKTNDFIKKYSVIILDEAHEYHSTCNLNALWLSQTQYVLGLSATPLERPDGLDRYITLHLGAVIYPKDIPNFDVSGVNFQANVKLIEYEGADPHCDTILTPSGTISSIMTINNILNDPYRLKLVVDEILTLNNIHLTCEGISHGLIREDLEFPKKHGIFVFVETRDFIITLRDALLKQMDASEIYAPEIYSPEIENPFEKRLYPKEELEPSDIGETASNPFEKRLYPKDNAEGDPSPTASETASEDTPISILRGGITKEDFENTKKCKSHIVLTTYGYSRRGISLPDMTALILVSPRRNGSTQIIGRILRRNSDEKIIRQIVDIVDVHTILKSQVNERLKTYREKFGKHNIKKIKKIWNEFD
jgi:superfamily II DNA or RNA helicase